jgi:hypothetical protein
MNTPEAFRTMCLKLSQDTPKPRFSSADEFLTYLFSGFTSDELNEIANFIAALLRDGVSDAQLTRIWREEGSDVLIAREAEGDMAAFFKMILNAVNDKRRAMQ